MEAARVDDEEARGDDFDDLDFEAAMAGPAEGSPPQEEKKGPTWDPERVKSRMAAILEESFGKKANKIIKELKKDSGSKLSLLEFREKGIAFALPKVEVTLGPGGSAATPSSEPEPDGPPGRDR